MNLEVTNKACEAVGHGRIRPDSTRPFALLHCAVGRSRSARVRNTLRGIQ